jgi:hypothetical protein
MVEELLGELDARLDPELAEHTPEMAVDRYG